MSKNIKAAGADSILSEFLKNVGSKGRTWFTQLATVVMQSSTLPKIWHEAKVIALLKPHKHANDPHSYRPISLVALYKVFKRLLHVHLEPTIDKILPVEQAVFRKNRNCCDQVLTFTTFDFRKQFSE